jgi:hypothetical protein
VEKSQKLDIKGRYCKFCNQNNKNPKLFIGSMCRTCFDRCAHVNIPICNCGSCRVERTIGIILATICLSLFIIFLIKAFSGC